MAVTLLISEPIFRIFFHSDSPVNLQQSIYQRSHRTSYALLQYLTALALSLCTVYSCSPTYVILLRTTDRSFRYTLSRLCGINFPFLRDNLVPVSISDYPCLTQRLSNQSFSSVDSPLSPFLLLEQRCGMACQEMLRRPRHCRCSEAEDVLVPTPLLRNCSTANDISYR